MEKYSILRYAGLYRATLEEASSNEELKTVLKPIHELLSTSGASSFLSQEGPLSHVLEGFTSWFMMKEKRMREALEEHDRLKKECESKWKEHIDCFIGQKVRLDSYPLTVSTGDTLDRKVSLPVSPNGLYIQVPEAEYASYCYQQLGEEKPVKKHSSDSSPTFLDGVTYTASSKCTGTRNAIGGQLYGYVLMLSSDVFQDSKCNENSNIVLCLVSNSPDFLFMKQLSVSISAVLHSSAVERRYKTFTTSLDAQLQTIWAELRDLTRGDSPLADVFPGRRLEIPCLISSRFTELRRPASMLYNTLDTPLSTLLLSFNYDALRLLHSLLLQERRVLFIGCNPQHASACAVSAPSLVAPLKWVAPLIPFVHPRSASSSLFLDDLVLPPAAEKVGALSESDAPRFSETSGFIIGSTSEIIPSLMLRWSALAVASGGFQARHQIWVADARSGNVGLLPLESGTLPSMSLGTVVKTMNAVSLLPVSDKLQNAVTAAVTESQRSSFRSVIAYFSQLSKTIMRLEGHNAFLRRLFEEGDSKGLYFERANTFVEPWQADAETAAYSCPNIGDGAVVDVHAAFLEYNTHRVCGEYRKGLSKSLTGYQLDTKVFLLSRLHSEELSTDIGQTQMMKQFAAALIAMESVGVKKVLQGLIPPTVTHPWILSPSVLADFCLFFSRARNRFSDLYPDLAGAVLTQWSLSLANKTLPPQGIDKEDVKWKGAGVMPSLVSLAGTASDGTSESKGSVLKFFSKASKAVKKLQNGEQQYIIPTRFAQAFNSFGSSSVEDRSPTAASPKLIMKSEFSLPDILGEKTVGKEESTACLPHCRRLPLDMIHHFANYHILLNPMRKTAYNSFFSVAPSRSENLKSLFDSNTDRMNDYTRFALLCPSSQRLWQSVIKLSRISATIAEERKLAPQNSPSPSADGPRVMSPVSHTTLSPSQEPQRVAPSLSDLFDSQPSPQLTSEGSPLPFSSGVPDGFSSGIPDGFSSGIPNEFDSGVPAEYLQDPAKHIDPNKK